MIEAEYECKKCGKSCDVEQDLYDSDWNAVLKMFICNGEYHSSCCDAGFTEEID